MGDFISAGLDFIGGILTNQANTDIANSANAAALQRQNEANAFNAAEAEKNRTYQTEQRATQYQTAVKDMMAAGLNPMLAYAQGGAKPTSGAQASTTAAPVNVPAPRVNALSSAVQAYRNAAANAATIKLQDEQVKATNAQTEVYRTQGLKNTAEALEVAKRTEKHGADIDVLRKTLEVQAAQILSLKAGSIAATASGAKDTAAVKGELPQQSPWWYQKMENSAKSAADRFTSNVSNWTSGIKKDYGKYQSWREQMLGAGK